jgi:hypothetical protein
VIWLALAAMQWQYGRLDPKVNEHSLRVIMQRGDPEVWGDASKRRAAVLSNEA